MQCSNRHSCPTPQGPSDCRTKKNNYQKEPEMCFSIQCFDPPSLTYSMEHLGVMQRAFGDIFTLSKIRWENSAVLPH